MTGVENITLENHSSSSEYLSRNGVLFNKESERIKSFVGWPINSPIDPERLAKAGFYYGGSGQEAICFSCNGRIRNWNYGDIVLKKHSELFPECDFINHRSNNIPITKSSKSNGDIKNANGDIKSFSDISEVGNNSELKTLLYYEKMKSENERLKTFSGKWPLTYINAAEISRAGFFYLGCEDRVQCPYCKVILSGWEAGDDPLKEHKKHYPTCEFFSNFNCTKTNKIKMWSEKNSQDVCGNMKKSVNSALSQYKLLDKNQQHTNLEALGVHLHKGPAHPQQASINARLRSFLPWPCNAPVSKDTLADAGFFYIGISDHTKCFHCDGGLCNWEYGDDPWVEHARWFRNCDFLRLNKGEEFIQDCVKKFSSMSSMEAPAQPPNAQYAKLLINIVDEAMDSELIKHVMETGLFPSYIVRAAILRQVKEKGLPFTNIDELCIAVSCLKEEMEKEPFEMENVGLVDLNILQSTHTSNDSSNSSTDNVVPLNTFQVETTSSHEKESPQLLTEDGSLKDQCLCKICMDKEVSIVFLPCGHLLSCTSCAPALKSCPMCRKTIQATVRAYLN